MEKARGGDERGHGPGPGQFGSIGAEKAEAECLGGGHELDMNWTAAYVVLGDRDVEVRQQHPAHLDEVQRAAGALEARREGPGDPVGGGDPDPVGHADHCAVGGGVAQPHQEPQGEVDPRTGSPHVQGRARRQQLRTLREAQRDPLGHHAVTFLVFATSNKFFLILRYRENKYGKKKTQSLVGRYKH
ncbi:hypothetical protein PMKS-001177 [Pichia membranifaciens]|uniref:Uncharacterized protein n=1 Tax=Pichia membranifaciens TaxID=4926 RepID=A0A1Q2YDU3_9ASCO|nr:hypothetical protein PMKS-001177 [Pichia membranifaciens]